MPAKSEIAWRLAGTEPWFGPNRLVGGTTWLWRDDVPGVHVAGTGVDALLLAAMEPGYGVL